MKYIKRILIMLLLFLDIQCYAQLARGADVGWLSEMEQSGRIWRDSNAVQRDVFDILDDYCINSIRLRVWVNPAGGWSGKQDVINLAKRAVAKGYRLMIDFHYSDSWADPGQQTKPAAWAGYSVSQLGQAVYDHTADVLNGLKAQNVTPEWVQVGNETNNGMLWPEGQASTNMANYATFVSKGYDAVKAVFPNAKVIVHVSNGYDNGLFTWNIGGLISNGAKFDIIAMSMYPDTPTGWQTYAQQTLTNMNDMITRYNKPIMISEIGLATSSQADAKLFVEQVIKNLQSLSNSRGLGIFWWEPQAYDWRGYGKVAWNGNTGTRAYQATDAMKGFKYGCTPSQNQAPIVNITAPLNNASYVPPASITINATASDPDGSINRVEFYNGNTKLGEDASSTYSFVWNNVAAGTYSITAIAYDNLGKSTTSSIITVKVGTVTTPDSTNVTFKVNTSATTTANGIYITGTFSGNPNWVIIPMTNSGNNIYSYTRKMAMKDSGAYYYLNANNWTSRETVPAACATWYNSDRGYKVSTANQIINDTWATCNLVTNLSNSTFKSSVQIFPNPFEEALSIKCIGSFTIEIYNGTGMLMQTHQAHETIQLQNDFPKGIYMLNIYNDMNHKSSHLINKK